MVLHKLCVALVLAACTLESLGAPYQAPPLARFGTVEMQRALCRATGNEHLFVYPWGIHGIGYNVTLESDKESVDSYRVDLVARACVHANVAIAHCHPVREKRAFLPSYGPQKSDVRFSLHVERLCAYGRDVAEHAGQRVRQYIVPSSYDRYLIEFALDPVHVLLTQLAAAGSFDDVMRFERVLAQLPHWSRSHGAMTPKSPTTRDVGDCLAAWRHHGAVRCRLEVPYGDADTGLLDVWLR